MTRGLLPLGSQATLFSWGKHAPPSLASAHPPQQPANFNNFFYSFPTSDLHQFPPRACHDLSGQNRAPRPYVGARNSAAPRRSTTASQVHRRAHPWGPAIYRFTGGNLVHRSGQSPTPGTRGDRNPHTLARSSSAVTALTTARRAHATAAGSPPWARPRR